ncbi:MAG: hypothetical protein LBV15_05120, partial [Planctomycetota bacterium]|nr:hypothetical protein [Planctomycetota bacterium]
MPGNDASPAAPEAPALSPESPLARLWRRFLKAGGARAGLFLVSFFALAAFLAPFLAHRLPLVWHDESGWSFPLLREFFSPSDTTEPLLESGVNFLLLYIPLSWLAWRLSRRFFPRLAAGESRLLAVAIGLLFSAFLWALLGGMLWEGAGKDWFYHEQRPVPEIEDVADPGRLRAGSPAGNDVAASAVWERLRESGLNPSSLPAVGEAAKKMILEPLQKAIEGPLLAPIGALPDREGAASLGIDGGNLGLGINQARWNRFL